VWSGARWSRWSFQLAGPGVAGEVVDRGAGELLFHCPGRAALHVTERALDALAHGAGRRRAVQPEQQVVALHGTPDVAERERVGGTGELPAAVHTWPGGDQAGAAERSQHAAHVHRVGSDAARQQLRAQHLFGRAPEQRQHVHRDGELGVRRMGHALQRRPNRYCVCYGSPTAITLHTDRNLMSLVLTGAGGQLGHRTAQLLLDQVEPSSVVLVSRRPEELADLTARGATARRGDFDDPASLSEAFAGGERLLLISTDAIGRRVPQHRNAIAAAQAAGVRAIAYTSLPNPTQDNPAAVAADHRQTEALVVDSGLQWTLLRNALYSEFRIPEAQAALTSGTFRHNQGDGRTAYVSREDCAAVAAAWLAGGAEHAGRTYDITGPELLGADDLARSYTSAGDSPVTAEDLPDDAFVAGLQAAGLLPDVAALLASFGTAIRSGHLDQRSTAVQDLTGRPPRTVSEVLSGAL